jgi:phospholipid-binding lipoprotein MlaA
MHSLMKYLCKFINFCLIIGMTIVLTSCCACKNKKDPLEKLNRGIFRINKTVDTLYIKPIALAYQKFIPQPYRYAVHSFMKNLRTIPTIANDILQGRFKDARLATARFVINTTWGIGGVLDVASMAHMDEHLNDFGLTLAHYGFKNSFYVVLPIAGPSTYCDTIGRGVDAFLNIWPYIKPRGLGWGLYGLYLLDTRVNLLVADPLIEEAAVDEYTFVREAYLQHRRYMRKECREDGIEVSEIPDLEDPGLEDEIEDPKDENEADGNDDETSNEVDDNDKNDELEEAEETREDKNVEKMKN